MTSKACHELQLFEGKRLIRHFVTVHQHVFAAVIGSVSQGLNLRSYSCYCQCTIKPKKAHVSL